MSGPHQLFAPRPQGAHGELHGGRLPGRRPTPPTFAHADAVAIGLVHAELLAPGAAFDIDLSLEKWWTPALERDDQATLGYCVYFAGDHACRIDSLQAGHADQTHSQLWMGWNVREKFFPSQMNVDTGAYDTQLATIVEGRGYALESDWPYDVSKFADPPPAASYSKALWYRNRVSVDVPVNLASMKASLAAKQGFMLAVGVYSSFYNAQGSPTGDVPMPAAGDSFLGGHEMYGFGGADDLAYAGGGYIRVLNQWRGFTPRNFLRIPYAYIGATGPDGQPCWYDNLILKLAPTGP